MRHIAPKIQLQVIRREIGRIVPKGLSGAIGTAPEVQGVQLFPAAGFEVAKELSPLASVTVEHLAHQHRPTGGLAAEDIDFTAEIGFGPTAQQTSICVRLLLDGRNRLIEGHGARRSFWGSPSGTQGDSIVSSRLNYCNLGRTHD